jgi:hypothetical protein
MLRLAREIVDQGAAGIGREELDAFRRTLARVTANLDRIER